MQVTSVSEFVNWPEIVKAMERVVHNQVADDPSVFSEEDADRLELMAFDIRTGLAESVRKLFPTPELRTEQ